MNISEGTLLRISQTDTVPGFEPIANLDPSAENPSFGCRGLKFESSETPGMGIDMRVTKEKFVSPESEK